MAEADPVKRAADKLGMPVEQVELVVHDLFYGIRRKMLDPAKLKLGILINGFIKFNIDFRQVRHYVNKWKNGTIKHPNSIYPLEYWEQMLNEYEYRKGKE